MRSGTLLVKPRKRFKWNEMANCGDAYVFFDPLGSSESMLASDSQSLAPYNGCQEVVSKGGLDRFIRPSRSSITLTFNTLGPNNKNKHLSRGSKTLNALQYVTGKISLCQCVEKNNRRPHITWQCLQNERKPYLRNLFVNKNTS